MNQIIFFLKSISKELIEIRDDKTLSDKSNDTAKRLIKIFKIDGDIKYIKKQIKTHKSDNLLKSMSSSPIVFVTNDENVHAEIALFKVAHESCKHETTVFIGVQKRLCYMCSLFFKTFTTVQFKVSIVTTHGKLYPEWNTIKGFFDFEFNQVLQKAKYVMESKIDEKKNLLAMKTDENSSEPADLNEEDNEEEENA